MDTFITSLSSGMTAFFSFKPYVILPVFMLILALIAKMRIKEALLATLRIGAGFAGVFVVFAFFVAQISPAIKAIISVRGLNYPVVDVGWPPLAAITWSTVQTPVVIVLIMFLNLAMLMTRATKTLYIDLWNYWHFAFLGAMVQSVTANVFLGIGASILLAVYTIKTAEWSAPYIKREMGIDGIAISPVSVSGFLPYAVIADRIFGAIPGFRRLNWNPSKAKESGKGPYLLREPMVIGIFVGIFLSVLAAYSVKQTLETAVNIAAVMFLLPHCGALIGEGMGAVSQAFKELMEKRFSGMTGLSIAMDTGILMTNQSVIATGLIMIPISLLIAFILPGNRVIPLGDLPNLISIMSVVTLIMRGNVIRSVLAGIPIVATFLLVASKMAPLYTQLAAGTGMTLESGGQEITAFTDGGSQVRYWMLYVFQGNIIALAIIPVVLAMMWYSWRQYRSRLEANADLENL